jgi:NAD+ synthase
LAGLFFTTMNYAAASSHIIDWLKVYSVSSRTQGFVIGISGGIDSALTSTLCALTGKPVMVLEMPIHQAVSQVSRAQEHIAWLKQHFPLVKSARVDLTSSYDSFVQTMCETSPDEHLQHLTAANTRARLRMTTLYYFAGIHRMLVAGTGNKIEDFGVGFYTKYGDGGVDLSPIADLTKTEVYAMACHLGVVDSILNAAPTDGLWGDDRTDEDQIGASYPELEWAMDFCERHQAMNDETEVLIQKESTLTSRQIEVLNIYRRMHKANRHKMDPIPVCLIPDDYKA